MSILPVSERWHIRLLWEPRDLWIGVYWTRRDPDPWNKSDLLIYICGLPCLPVLLTRHAR